MIDVILRYIDQTILVRVDGCNVYFMNSDYGNVMASIDGLKFSREGVLKQFPDLNNSPDWRAQALERFKDKIRSLPNEVARINYIIDDLKMHGYKPIVKQKAGHRPEKLT